MVAFFIAQDAEAEEEEEYQADTHEQATLPEASAGTKQDPKQRLAGKGVVPVSAEWCCTLHSSSSGMLPGVTKELILLTTLTCLQLSCNIPHGSTISVLTV